MHETKPQLTDTDFPRLRRRSLQTLQMNLGYLCNLACTHCHVAAGPKRTELMDRDTIDIAIEFLRTHRIQTLDVTGGSPEMNPHFRDLVQAHAAMGVHVMDRCNPTILNEPGYDWVGRFSGARTRSRWSPRCPATPKTTSIANAARPCSSAASPPCKSSTGSATAGPAAAWSSTWSTTRRAVLPPAQEALEDDYRQHLAMNTASTSIGYSRLRTCRSSASAACCCRKDQFGDYMTLLKNAYRAGKSGRRDVPRSRSAWTGAAMSTTATSTRCWTCRWALRPSRAYTCATCSMPILPARRSRSPIIVTAVPPDRAAAAAVR